MNNMTGTIANKLKSLYDNLVIAINFINEGINLKADKVSSATSGNFAGLDNTGNLTDSGKKASDFAAASHTHSIIKYGAYGEQGAQVGTGASTGSGGAVYMNVSKFIDGTLQAKQVWMDYGNIDNLDVALKDPAAPADPTAQGYQPKLITNGQVYTALVPKANKTTTMNVASSVSAQALSPNVLYTFLERTTDLTLTLTAGLLTEANEYHFFLIIGSTAPTITWPTGISWNGGSAPTIAADKTYEVSILNNVAAFIEIDNPEEESES